MNTTTKLSKAELAQFTGTEHYYRHALNPRVLFTDGARHVADHGNAHWLLDLIAVSQRYDKRIANQPFQVWALAMGPDSSAIVTAEDGNKKLLCTHRLEFCDFPVPGITLWLSNQVIYLPSEH